MNAITTIQEEAAVLTQEATALTVQCACACGCGEPSGSYLRTNKTYGYIAGQPRKFVPNHHQRKSLHHKWNGGTSMSGDGYMEKRNPSHVRASQRGYVKKHILIAEEALGHLLPPRAVVHHVNGQRSDNRNRNLVICHDQSYHLLLHQRQRAYIATGNPLSVKCSHCSQWGLSGVGEMRTKDSGRSYHLKCNASYEQARKAGR